MKGSRGPKVSNVLAKSRKAKALRASQAHGGPRLDDVRKAAADWAKRGYGASRESFSTLAKHRSAMRGGPKQRAASTRPAAVAKAAARKSGASAKEQAAIHRASKGTALDRLRALEKRADARWDKVKGRDLNDKVRTAAYDRSVEVSRRLYRAEQGKSTLAKGRGTAQRKAAADLIRRITAANPRKSAAASLPKPIAPRDQRPGYRRPDLPEHGRTKEATTASFRKAAAERLKAERAAKRGAPAPAPRPEPPPAPKPKPKTIKVKVVRDADPASHTNHPPGHVGKLNADLLHTDPERFQYKLAPAQGGNTGSLAGVRKWDDELAGVVQVWKDPGNGKTYVVNGHNRAHLAQSMGVKQLTVRFITAKTADEARAKGALTNIAEGRGDAMDAAKFFRDSGIADSKALEARGIPLREKVATDGLALARLEPKLFRRVVDGEFPRDRAVIIGGSGLDHSQQDSLVKLIDGLPKKMNVNNATVYEMADEIRSSETIKKGQSTLFGEDVEEVNLGVYRTKLQAEIKDRLRTEKKLFGNVAKSKNAKKLERGNNTIDTEASGTISREAAEALDVFDRLKRNAGPISAKLNEGAARLHAGENARKVNDEVYRDILASIPEALRF